MQVFVVLMRTQQGDMFDVVGVYKTYEAAQRAARESGVNQTLVRATSLHS